MSDLGAKQEDGKEHSVSLQYNALTCQVLSKEVGVVQKIVNRGGEKASFLILILGYFPLLLLFFFFCISYMTACCCCCCRRHFTTGRQFGTETRSGHNAGMHQNCNFGTKEKKRRKSSSRVQNGIRIFFIVPTIRITRENQNTFQRCECARSRGRCLFLMNGS